MFSGSTNTATAITPEESAPPKEALSQTELLYSIAEEIRAMGTSPLSAHGDIRDLDFGRFYTQSVYRHGKVVKTIFAAIAAVTEGGAHPGLTVSGLMDRLGFNQAVYARDAAVRIACASRGQWVMPEVVATRLEKLADDYS